MPSRALFRNFLSATLTLALLLLTTTASAQTDASADPVPSVDPAAAEKPAPAQGSTKGVQAPGVGEKRDAVAAPTGSAAAEAGKTAAETKKKAENEADKKAEKTLLGAFNEKMFKVLLFDVAFGAVTVDVVDKDGKGELDEAGQPKQKVVGIPFLVVILVFGALFFTFYYRWINIRGFKHAVAIVRGKYDNPDDEGEISHFRALTSALSATVGLGNIAGVAIAITKGGPGAVVWMMIIALFGMTAKFSSCTLAQLYRKVNDDGSISGGPMYYLDLGLKKMGGPWGTIGKFLAVTYAFMIMGGAFGGGNMFQANQTMEALTYTFGWQVTGADGTMIPSPTASWTIGIVMAVLVAAVILGGIKRIGAATSKIVPAMCGIYVLASLFVILTNLGQLPSALSQMFQMAFTENAVFGGMMGVLVTGVTRAAFSNEAGLGSASIAHAAAKTDEPVREGMVAMMGPFIDTIVVCLMTSMVVIITGAWSDPTLTQVAGINPGVKLTAFAFESVISWFPYILAVCIALFAYSTMISWCYYGERGWIYLLDHFGDKLGQKSVIGFRIIFVFFVVFGAVNKLGDVLDFSDIMILSMAFPNIIGSVILAPKLLPKVKDYWERYSSGQMKTYDELLAEKEAS